MVGTVGFRLLLTLSLWHAPIPWGHVHFEHSAELAEHVALHHAHEHDPQHLGWHWHLVLPDWGHPAPLSGSGGDSGPLVSLSFDAAIATAATIGPIRSLPGSDFMSPPADVLASLPLRYERQAFLGTYSPSHSAQQMLCRLCC